MGGCPLFPKPVAGHELFFAVSYSKPTLMWGVIKDFEKRCPFTTHSFTITLLLGKFGKELNLSIRNNDGLNPLDLAVVKKNSAIIKLVCKHTKPEVSSLGPSISIYPTFIQLLSKINPDHIRIKSG